jgi:hypothetical protein
MKIIILSLQPFYAIINLYCDRYKIIIGFIFNGVIIFICLLSFLSCFYHLYMTIRLIINSLVGIPLFSDNTYELSHKIKIKDLKRFIKSKPELNFKLFLYQNLKKIFELDTLFKNEWENKILPMKLKEYKSQKLHKNQILIYVDKDEKDYFIKYLSESNKFKELKKDFPNLEQFLQAQQIINNEEFSIEEEYNKKYDKYINELNKNTIRVLCSDWKKEKIKKYEEEQKKRER